METKNIAIEILDPRSFPAAVADELVASINEAVADHGKCCIALAGGSTPSATYRLLSMPPRVKDIPWNKVYFFWGDERWASHDSAQSNFRMTQETFLTASQVPDSNIFPIDTSLKNPELGAKAYSDLIKSVVPLNSQDIPIFDIVLLGIGEDGHTASLFPGSAALDNQDICTFTDRPDGLQGITLSKSVLINAKRMIFMVTGEGKAEVLQEILEGSPDYSSKPAVLYRESRGSVIWFVDSAAAKSLEKRQEESA